MIWSMNASSSSGGIVRLACSISASVYCGTERISLAGGGAWDGAGSDCGTERISGAGEAAGSGCRFRWAVRSSRMAR